MQHIRVSKLFLVALFALSIDSGLFAGDDEQQQGKPCKYGVVGSIGTIGGFVALAHVTYNGAMWVQSRIKTQQLRQIIDKAEQLIAIGNSGEPLCFSADEDQVENFLSLCKRKYRAHDAPLLRAQEALQKYWDECSACSDDIQTNYVAYKDRKIRVDEHLAVLAAHMERVHRLLNHIRDALPAQDILAQDASAATREFVPEIADEQ